MNGFANRSLGEPGVCCRWREDELGTALAAGWTRHEVYRPSATVGLVLTRPRRFGCEGLGEAGAIGEGWVTVTPSRDPLSMKKSIICQEFPGGLMPG